MHHTWIYVGYTLYAFIVHIQEMSFPSTNIIFVNGGGRVFMYLIVFKCISSSIEIVSLGFCGFVLWDAAFSLYVFLLL